MARLSSFLIGLLIGLVILLIAANIPVCKNLMGDLAGFGDCPNCGDSWAWKEYSSLDYQISSDPEADGLITVEGAEDVGLISVSMSCGMLICTECKAHPESIDAARVARDLKESQWSDENIAMVVLAIEKLTVNE
jgi:hypothetical protein